MSSTAMINKVRIYDLAKELKQDTKRIIEELRREGADVSVPSNSVSKELAEKIRNRYFPKKEVAPQRTIKVIKKERPAVQAGDSTDAATADSELRPPVEASAAYPVKTAKEEKTITPVLQEARSQQQQSVAAAPPPPRVIKPLMKKVQPETIEPELVETAAAVPAAEAAASAAAVCRDRNNAADYSCRRSDRCRSVAG
jgi:translation initiation factor IF-2